MIALLLPTGVCSITASFFLSNFSRAPFNPDFFFSVASGVKVYSDAPSNLEVVAEEKVEAVSLRLSTFGPLSDANMFEIRRYGRVRYMIESARNAIVECSV